MKKVFNFFILFILIGSIGCITYLTVYILNNKGVKEEVSNNVSKSIEKVTSNIAGNTFFEIYNVYLNGQRHKVKFEYNARFREDGMGNISIIAYFDGKSIIEENVVKNLSVEDGSVWDDKNINNYVKLDENSIKIIKNDNIEYMIIEVGYYNEFASSKFFAFNDNGDDVLKKSILVKDYSKYYVNNTGEELGFFYGYDGAQLLAKIEKDVIYSLEVKVEKEIINIEEYKYVIIEDKFEKELINTYKNVMLKEELQESTNDTTKE